MTYGWQGPEQRQESGPTQPTNPPWVTLPPPPPPVDKGPRVRMPVAIVAVLMLVAVAVGTVVGHGLWSSNGRVASLQSASSGSGAASSGPADVGSVAAAVDPALVDINATFPYQGAQGAGTGIVLTSNGEILTNNHVIQGAANIKVTDIGNGKTYSATVVGYDSSADIAVLQLSGASGLQTAKLGNSGNLAVGQSVVGLGNAGGAGGTPSAASGAITALDQSITAGDSLSGTNEQLSGLIQTDANIQAGDSGGALANSAGQVVGMNTAGSSSGSSSGSSGLTSTTQGFAIPINQAISVANQIESGHSSSTVHVGPTAFIGVLVESSAQNGSGGGATISSVVSGGPAEQAGLAAGDTITSIDGQTVTSASSLGSIIGQDKPGTTVQVGWADSYGQAQTTTIQLGSGPAA